MYNPLFDLIESGTNNLFGIISYATQSLHNLEYLDSADCDNQNVASNLSFMCN